MAQKHDVQAVLFDAGNTLLFPDYDFIRVLLAEYGIDVKVAKLREAEYEAKVLTHKTPAHKPWNQFFGIWLSAVGVQQKVLPEMLSRLWQRHRERNLWSLLEKTAVETLTALKAKDFRLGVISNSDGRLDEQMQDLGLSGFFEALIDSEVVGCRKPDTRIFEIALSRLNLQPKACLYVGDSYEIDVLGARKAGMQAVLFDPLDKAKHVAGNRVSRLNQILDLL